MGGGEIGSSSWTQLRLTWIHPAWEINWRMPRRLEARGPDLTVAPCQSSHGAPGMGDLAKIELVGVQTGLSSLVGFTGGCHHLLVIAWLLLLSRILRKLGSTMSANTTTYCPYLQPPWLPRSKTSIVQYPTPRLTSLSSLSIIIISSPPEHGAIGPFPLSS